MKSSELGAFTRSSFLVTFSFSSMEIGLFKLSVSTGSIFVNYIFLREYPFNLCFSDLFAKMSTK